MSEDERVKLEQAIASLDAQRSILGDGVVNTALASLYSKVEELKRQEAAAQRTEQRKVVTVLFADITGFTAMSEKMDVEDVSLMINNLWARLDILITSHGGKIDKHIGDAVMALWGADVAREDDPERAIRAALAMQADVSQASVTGAQEGVTGRLALRIGIHTGPVLLGEVGVKGEFTAIGDTVNTASRLEHAAPPGQVLISHETYSQVRGLFETQPQEPLAAKGKTELLRTYLVRRARPRSWRTVTRGIEGVQTPLMGREVEMTALQNAFQALLTVSRSRRIVLVGEPGVGKSRLLNEFEGWLERQPGARLMLRGRATAEIQTTTYGLLRDVFANYCDIREADSAAVALVKFRAGMNEFLEPRKADLVGQMIGFDFSGSRAVQNLLGSASFKRVASGYLMGLFHLAAASWPTILLLEDVHWADDPSLEFIENLLSEVATGRLLVICLARPALFDRHPNWGMEQAVEQDSTRLELNPLAPEDSRALVDAILQRVENVPADLRELVVTAAEGNPYYLEELIKKLIDDGVIVTNSDAAPDAGQGSWRVVPERLAGLRLPPTLFGMLQARLDSLPARERQVLQQASVVGREFWDATLAYLEHKGSLPSGDNLTSHSQELETALQFLGEREMVFRRESSTFEGTQEYFFKHNALREVAYETLLLKMRRSYHAQVAAWLEATAGERLGEYLGLIARHYELAGDARRAAEYLRRQGEEISKVNAYRSAAGVFLRALELLPETDIAERANLLERIGSAYSMDGENFKAGEYLQQALDLAREHGYPEVEVAALNSLGRTALELGDYEQSETALRQALSLARQLGDRPNAARALRNLGVIIWQWGQIVEGRRCAEESLAIYRELEQPQGAAEALNLLGVIGNTGSTDTSESIQHFQEALEIFRQIGDRRGEGTCLNNLGDAGWRSGDYRSARNYFEQALEIARETNDRHSVALALLNLGLVSVRLEFYREAWEYLLQALYDSLALGFIANVLWVLTGLAEWYKQTGQAERAVELLGFALNHPANNVEIKETALPLLESLHLLLPEDKFDGAQQHGRSLGMEGILKMFR